MFRAAFTSRSCSVPQAGQLQVRTLRAPSPFGPLRSPHAEQSWVDGCHRSIFTTRRPDSAALYSSIATKDDHPASWIDLARFARPRPATLSASTTTAWFSRIRRALSWWWKARRASATRACSLATLRRCLSRLLDPFCRRLSDRWALRRTFWRCRSQRGLATFSPVERVAKWVRPRSIPTWAGVEGNGASWTWTTNEAW